MRPIRTLWIALAIALSGVVHAQSVAFDWFEYRGHDAVFDEPLAAGHYRNPILSGFYPDPSVTRVEDKFYLVNSTFSYFPGIPVFESKDLVHWQHIGNVIDRPSQLNFTGLGMSRGVFAPAISYHAGIFYVLNTAVDNGGNYISTAKNPAGPWSDPVWLKEIDGIDTSLFVDTDGKAYVLNNGPPEDTPQYDGHRAVWIQELDLATLKVKGPRKVLVNGGVDFSKKPIWIEGPHLFTKDHWYYLSCAEGGTGPNHSQVILRSKSPWGPFIPYEHNPILTQRDLPDDRANPITNAGHAELVEAPDGTWWATFLATRTYDDGQYNTGRETFLLPVTWKDGWPIILEANTAIEYQHRAPRFMTTGDQAPMTGNFSWRDDFSSPSLNKSWLQLRNPKHQWFDLTSKPGWLSVHPSTTPLDSLDNPSFLARRQQHMAFEASTAFTLPKSGKIEAGIAAFQNEHYWYFFGVRRAGKKLQVFVEQASGKDKHVIASTAVSVSHSPKLKIAANKSTYSFYFDIGEGWQLLLEDHNGTILSTKVAGGFVGAVMGPYARSVALTQVASAQR